MITQSWKTLENCFLDIVKSWNYSHFNFILDMENTFKLFVLLEADNI